MLSCSVDEHSSEIRRAWPSVSRLYVKSYQETRGKPNHRSVCKQFLCSADNGIVSKHVPTNHDSQINSIKHIIFREELLTAGNDMQPTKESSPS